MKNKNKLCPYKKLSVFYNSCLKTFGSHLVLPEDDADALKHVGALTIYKMLLMYRVFQEE